MSTDVTFNICSFIYIHVLFLFACFVDSSCVKERIFYNIWERPFLLTGGHSSLLFSVSILAPHPLCHFYLHLWIDHVTNWRDKRQRGNIYFLRNWVFVTNSNFLMSISLQYDDANLWYFKLRLFDLTELIVRNFKWLRH